MPGVPALAVGGGGSVASVLLGTWLRAGWHLGPAAPLEVLQAWHEDSCLVFRFELPSGSVLAVFWAGVSFGLAIASCLGVCWRTLRQLEAGFGGPPTPDVLRGVPSPRALPDVHRG